jgi:hypothetical protein
MITKETLDRIRAVANDERGDPATRAVALLMLDQLKRRYPTLDAPSASPTPDKLPRFEWKNLTITIVRRQKSVRYRHGSIRFEQAIVGFGYEISNTTGVLVSDARQVFTTVDEAKKAAQKYVSVRFGGRKTSR